uniref:RMT2 domain-containing protein n=1 Tax=Corethron hystrix TaxID=216773 RepID=A0A7S1B6W4_9STRA|mmetsp:Transcript_15287/g.34236  ORF Transcript_15287/g.34236 Transcript_15287/m.34236 type:complete len:314 (+) Transcript_15287:521-1462(+)
MHEIGAPWNAIDKDGKCAGNYASDLGHQSLVNYLVDVAVTAELLLGASIRTEMSTTYTSKEATKPIVDIGTGSRCGGPVEHEPCTKSDFLSRDVCYVDGDKLLDGDGDAVMMEWERPLMRAHASVIMGGSGTSATGKVSVMNVGFGMGIIDSILQEEQFSPALHVIVEAHPGVYAQMIKDGWDKKPNVRIVYGKWQDEVPKLIEEGIKFDGVFFDTYGEHFTDLEDFQNLLVDLLKKPAGVYSFFNGLAPDNIFFHGVACQCVKLQLSGIGFNVEFATCDIDVSDEAWKGVRRKYWHNCTYYLPIITWANENS